MDRLDDTDVKSLQTLALRCRLLCSRLNKPVYSQKADTK